MSKVTGGYDDSLATGERMVDYGHPSISFERIATLWSAYLGASIQKRDVAVMMMLLKISRLATSTRKDTLDDIEGYVSCLRMIEDDIAP